MRVAWRPVLVATFVAVVLSTCGGNAPSTGGPSASGVRLGGRTACDGGVPQVASNLKGPVVDALEQLQETYGDDPGFLAVVWDGRRSVIVVTTGQLLAWQARLAPLGIAVARSCVDPALLAIAKAALPGIKVPEGAIASVGYDGLADAISVLGVEPEQLFAAMEAVQPGARSAAIAAVADGTLRIDSARIINVWQP